MQETQVWSLGQKDSPGKGMATHSSILAWEISWTGEPGRLQSMGLQSVGHDWVTNTRIHIHWIFIGRTDAEAEAPVLWPPILWQRTDSLEKPWCWERLKAGGEGYKRGWDGWKASPTQWTWVWADSRRWWRTGNPGVLQSMGSQRVRHDWVTKQQHYVFIVIKKFISYILPPISI